MKRDVLNFYVGRAHDLWSKYTSEYTKKVTPGAEISFDKDGDEIYHPWGLTRAEIQMELFSTSKYAHPDARRTLTIMRHYSKWLYKEKSLVCLHTFATPGQNKSRSSYKYMILTPGEETSENFVQELIHADAQILKNSAKNVINKLVETYNEIGVPIASLLNAPIQRIQDTNMYLIDVDGESRKELIAQ